MPPFRFYDETEAFVLPLLVTKCEKNVDIFLKKQYNVIISVHLDLIIHTNRSKNLSYATGKRSYNI